MLLFFCKLSLSVLHKSGNAYYKNVTTITLSSTNTYQYLEFFIFFKKILIEVQLPYNIILVSGVDHDSIFVYTEIISTINLVNIHHHTELQRCFSCDENFKDYFFSKFQMCKTVFSTTITMLCIISL